MSHLELQSWEPSNEYKGRVQRLYKQSLSRSLFSTHCRRLAEFLRNAPNQPLPESSQFAWLYELSGDSLPLGRAFNPSMEIAESAKYLLFLAGYPSKHELLQLGNLFDIDPAFFDTHLSFIGHDVTSCEIHPSYYTLPSQRQTIFQTSVPCVGGAPEDPRYDRLSEKRADLSGEMDHYLSRLKTGAGWKAFNSIVRAVEIHDSRRFSIHQNITVLIKQSTQAGGWLVVIWSDAGADLTTSPKGPWIDSVHGVANTHFRPVVLPRFSASAALDDEFRNSAPLESAYGLHQTISLLPMTYGTSIDPDLFARDPVYALSELFAFIAIAISQYLDVIRSVFDHNLAITSQVKQSKRNEVRALLSYSYNGLDKQHDQITVALTFLRGQLDRIGTNDSSAVLLIVRDYEYLLARNNELLARCDHEWNVIMSEAAVEDAQWSRDQSKAQHKFVLLATVYVPLSFSCSIFGMTFFELDSLQSGFTLWLAVSASLFVLSILFLFWNQDYVKLVIKRTHRQLFIQDS